MTFTPTTITEDNYSSAIRQNFELANDALDEALRNNPELSLEGFDANGKVLSGVAAAEAPHDLITYQDAVGLLLGIDPLKEKGSDVFHSVLTGGVDESSFQISAYKELSSDVRLVVSKKVSLIEDVVYDQTISPVPVGVVIDTVYRVKTGVTGLAADTQYYYAIIPVGDEANLITGKVRTAPTPLANKSYSFALGSCCRSTVFDNRATALSLLKDKDLAFYAHVGDFVYGNIAKADQPAIELSYFFRLAESNTLSLYRNVPLAYTWDDHDSGPNDNTMSQYPAGTHNVPNADDWEDYIQSHLDAYKAHFPHYPFKQPPATGWTETLAQSWPWGRVYFIMPDGQTQFDSDYGQTGLYAGKKYGDGTGSRLATWDQIQWMKDEMLYAKAQGYPLVVMLLGRWPYGVGGISASWGAMAKDEQEDFMQFMRDNDIPETIIMFGDIHNNLFNDGKEWSSAEALAATPYEDGVDPFYYDIAWPLQGPTPTGQIPTICSSGESQQGNAFPTPVSVQIARWNGTFFTSTIYKSTTMVIDIVDDGGDRIKWTATQYSDDIANGFGGKPPPLQSASNYDFTSTVEFDAVGATPSVGDTYKLGVVRDEWFGRLEVPFTIDPTGTAVQGVDYTITASPVVVNAHAYKGEISITILPTATPGRLMKLVLQPGNHYNLGTNIAHIMAIDT